MVARGSDANTGHNLPFLRTATDATGPHWQWLQPAPATVELQQHSSIALPLHHATPSRRTRLCANPQLELEITGLGLGRMLVTTDIRYLPVPACGMRSAPTENYDTTGSRQRGKRSPNSQLTACACLSVFL